jgi:hypothetical protein
MQERPILSLIKKTAEKIDNFIGISDNQIQALRHLVCETFGFKKIGFEIDLYSNPRTITIRAFLSDSNKEVYLKPKHPEVLEKMLLYLQIKDYVLKFKEKPNE